MVPIWLSDLHGMLPAALSGRGRSGGEDYDSGANAGAGLYCGARCRRRRHSLYGTRIFRDYSFLDKKDDLKAAIWVK